MEGLIKEQQEIENQLKRYSFSHHQVELMKRLIENTVEQKEIKDFFKVYDTKNVFKETLEEITEKKQMKPEVIVTCVNDMYHCKDVNGKWSFTTPVDTPLRIIDKIEDFFTNLHKF